MSNRDAVAAIRKKFSVTGNPAQVPKLKSNTRGATFEAKLVSEGVYVDNLGNQPFLPWIVFQEAVNVIVRNGGAADRGNVMRKGTRLGDPELSLDSLEGHIASVVYGKKIGKAIFRRATPVACILIWADVCEAGPGYLQLKQQ